MVGRAASRGYNCPSKACAEACFDGGLRKTFHIKLSGVFGSCLTLVM